MARNEKSDTNLIRRLLSDARPYWPHVAGILMLDLLATPLALLTPVPLKLAVDSVLGSEPVPEFLFSLVPASWLTPSALLIFVVVLLVVIALLTQVQGMGAGLLRAYTGGKLVLQFRTQLFRHAQRLSFTYHDMKGISDTLYRVQYDTAAIERVIIEALIPMIAAAVTLVAMIYVTAKINMQLAMVALIVAPIIVSLNRFYRRPLRTRWRAQKKLDHAAMSVVGEVFSALRVVKAFNQEEREQDRYEDRAAESLIAKLRVTVLQGSFDIVASFMTSIGTAAVLYIGVNAILSGAMTVGDLLIVMTYVGLLYAPLTMIGRRIASMQSALVSAERAFALMDECPDVPERTDAVALEKARGELEFSEVSFAYDRATPILHDINLRIPAGSRVGIVGKTGAGKTTFLSLLMRFYDPTAGKVMLDGTNLNNYKLKDLRNQFAMVLQDTILFSTTIYENIAYARSGASEEEIIEAAKAAQAHEFITELPKGYQTVVGERGMRLSGGERQRVALARAFLKDAPILLLDEPTSAVDTKTEMAIMNVMDRLMAGRTTFMIAHRLSTLDICDTILHLENGRLVSVQNQSPNSGDRMSGVTTPPTAVGQ
jgi:ATP-binding cassette subfamily B protein